MIRLIIPLFLILSLCQAAPLRDSLKAQSGAPDLFIGISNQLVSSGNHQQTIKEADRICSGLIIDTSVSSFDEYLLITEELNNSGIIPAVFNELNDEKETAVMVELLFRIFIAVQHKMEQLYWQMPDTQKIINAAIFATTNHEISYMKTSLLNAQLTILSSSGSSETRLRIWQGLRRMLNEIDIPLSENGDQIVQRSPYGIISRKGTLMKRLKSISDNETSPPLKSYAVSVIDSVSSSGQKYKDISRPIVIGVAPEILGQISKDALDDFNLASSAETSHDKIALYTKAIEHDSIFPAAYFNRGAAHFELKNYSAAIKDFEYVLVLNPSYSDVYPRLGDCCLQSGQYRQAIIYYSKALQLERRLPALLISRGICYSKINDFRHAIRDYSDAIKLDTASVIAYTNRVQCYLAVKDYDNAISDYEMLIKMRPDNSTYYYNLGCIYWEHKNYVKVNEIWSKGLRVNPYDQNIIKNLPQIKAKLK